MASCSHPLNDVPCSPSLPPLLNQCSSSAKMCDVPDNTPMHLNPTDTESIRNSRIGHRNPPTREPVRRRQVVPRGGQHSSATHLSPPDSYAGPALRGKPPPPNQETHTPRPHYLPTHPKTKPSKRRRLEMDAILPSKRGQRTSTPAPSSVAARSRSAEQPRPTLHLHRRSLSR